MGRQHMPEKVALKVKSSEYCCLSPADLGVREDSVGCMSAKVILVEEKLGLMEKSKKRGVLYTLELHARCQLPISRKVPSK